MQPGDVLVQREDLVAINRHDFIDAITKHKTAIEHGNARVFRRHPLAIQICYCQSRYLFPEACMINQGKPVSAGRKRKDQ